MEIGLLRSVLLPLPRCILTALKLPGRRQIVCVRFASCVQRGGKDLAKRHASLNPENLLPQSSALPGNRSVENRGLSMVRTIQGLKIPQTPLPPTAEECCMSRCETCVHDLYVVSLQRYRQDLRELRKTLAGMQLSCQEWPIEIHSDGTHCDDTMDKELLVATEAAQRAFRDMNYVEVRQAWKTTELWLEAVRMVIWVLRGCRE